VSTYSGSGRQVTIVTGGSRGIGAATAHELARHDHDIAIVYRHDTEAAEATAASVRAMGATCITIRADITDEHDADIVFDRATAELGTVTGLVNNAGLTAHLAELADTPPAIIRRVVDVNLLGTIWYCRRAALSMSTRRGGTGGAIVNVSSAAATLGSPSEYVHYAAAKAGVDALTIGLAKELASHGIRVNAVAPGTIDTSIHADAGDPDRAQRVAARVPLGRAGRPDEIAPAIAWLLSPQAAYTTGAIIRIAGGL
jgi:NAD(P)-dependent dehydrogenase (short-subunit alcohol dehydrogenase family)